MATTRYLRSALLGLCLGGQPAHAIDIKLSGGGYSSSDGLSKQKQGLAGEWRADFVQQTMNQAALALDVQEERIVQEEWEENDYWREVYGDGTRRLRRGRVAVQQTWAKLTETRASASYSGDRLTSTRSYQLGFSRWLASEVLRVAVDGAWSKTERPPYQYLDFDTLTVSTPPNATSRGGSLALRHLATPSTIVDYSGSYTTQDFRPPTKTFAIALRQFVAPVRGAAHLSVTRAENRGRVTTSSDYGQVDAGIVEAAWLQHLGRAATARAAYRYYREDETTRAFADEKTLGTDTVIVGYSQEISQGASRQPWSLDLVLARYLTNLPLTASSVELAVSTRL